MNNTKAKTVNQSRTTITELMIPAYANFGGKVHGGIILSLMDKVAYACASKHAGGYCVTVSVDTVDFLKSVEVGNLVSLMASVNYVGRSSLVVGIKVISENVKTGEIKHTNTSYFTMVAVDDYGKSRQVAELILESRTDVRRYLEALKRIELKKRYSVELDNSKTSLEVDEGMKKLKDYRCQLKLD